MERKEHFYNNKKEQSNPNLGYWATGQKRTSDPIIILDSKF